MKVYFSSIVHKSMQVNAYIPPIENWPATPSLADRPIGSADRRITSVYTIVI